jgi:predicted Zn-dependent protease with MMP-like domain
LRDADLPRGLSAPSELREDREVGRVRLRRPDAQGRERRRGERRALARHAGAARGAAPRRGARHPRLARRIDERPDIERYIEEAVASIPDDLRADIENVQIVVADEPSDPGLLGLYQGIPLTRRGAFYSGTLPDKITIYRGPLERLYGHDPERLRAETRRVVLHEIAHHFGISDARLVEIDRY